jgi:hypothetical protein
MEKCGVLRGCMSKWDTRFRAAAVTLVLLVGCPMMAMGQAQNTGTVSGNVKDSQAKVIVKAEITLFNTATDAKRVETTNAGGEYLFSDVAVGDYILTVTAPGFGTTEVDSLHVDADANVRTDATLRLASVNQEVRVESQGMTLDTRSATLGTLIDKNEVENLPVDGNNVVSLTALLPGVSNVNAPTTFTSDTGGPTFNISGSRNNQNLFLLDGQLWNNLFYNTGLNFPPGQALQEISILLNNYKAQYGRNVGSIMNVLTRSGTNRIHGSLWEYAQNKAFNAADYISQANPHLVQNQFGATIGGAIKRDKIFYFLALQDLRVAQAVFSSAELLTPQERGWDVAPTATTPGTPHMCQYIGFQGMQCASFAIDFPASLPNPANSSVPSTVPYYNQYLRNPLENSTYSGGFISQENAAWQQAGNSGNSPCYTALAGLYANLGTGPTFYKNYLPYEEMPAICFNPVSVAFLNKYIPYPNAIGANGLPVSNLTAPQPRNDWDGLARVDFILGRHTVDARFYVTNVNDVTSNSASNSGSAPGVATYEQDLNSGGIYYGNIGDTYTLTPNLLNVFRAGYKRYGYLINPTDPTTLQSLGSSLVQPAKVPSLPQVEVENRFKVGSANSTWSWTVNEDEEVDDNLSWTRGNHNFQVGVQYLHLQYLHRFDSSPFVESGLSYTQSDASDFMAGLLAGETVGNSTNLGALQNNFYTYLQDDWRATPKLTLNYGIRYELPFAWRSADDQGVTFSPGFQSRVIPSAPVSLGYEGDPFPGNAKVRSRFNNVAPRFGFAYDVNGNGSTLIRGGMGIFFDALNAAVIGVGSPFHYLASYTDPAGGMSQPLLGEPAIAPNYTKGSTSFGTPLSVNSVDPNLAMPYTMAINFGFQRRIRATGMLELNYVGKLGRHQLIQYDLNPAIFDCTGAYYASNPALYCPGGAGSLSSTTASTSEQARVKYPGFAYGGQGAVDSASIGTSSYNGLQLMYTQMARKSIKLKASYTYSKSLDLQSNGQTTSNAIPNPSNLHSQYAVSDFDAAQILNIGWVYDLPKTTRFDAPIRAVLNNWIFSGIYNARTGMPVNVTIAGDQAFTGEPHQRPNQTPGVSQTLPSGRHRSCPAVTGSLTNCKVQAWFNNVTVSGSNNGSNTVCVAPAAFCSPAFGTLGNVGRNSLRGPAFIATSMAVGRLFPLPREGATLEFKADAFNVFNTPNLANPASVLSNSTSNSTINTFGVVLATVGTNGNVGTNGRRMQLSLVLRY